MKHAITVYLATATAALAHPGHGEAPGHWLTQADHIIGLAVLGIVGGLIFARLRNRE